MSPLPLVLTRAGQTVHYNVDPSKVVLTKLRLDRARKGAITRSATARQKSVGDKGKHSEGSVSAMSTVD